ncbi:MAG: hypothetical protein LBS10_01595 [Gracilibacteraceae bacterium]|jgi:hypothetical protein|nr:hypothetical protein [Gracilibacteraceae bacterium]
MMMRKKTTALVAMLIAALLAGCASLDVVGRQSVTSFDAVLQAIPAQVAADETNGGFALTAPDGAVRLIWSEDYSQSPLHDVMLELDAQPFLDAGLAPEKLPADYIFYEGEATGAMAGPLLMVGVKLGSDALRYSGEATPLAAYEQIVSRYRQSINFHTALDHFGVLLGDGNMFEWAKDLSTNSATNEAQDKDIVYVLNPEPLIAAGVDPEKLAGWVYAQVPTDDGDVWKFLKPFDLK